MYETFILGGLLLCIILWMMGMSSKIKKSANTIPGPPAIPFFGNLFNAVISGPQSLKFFSDMAKKYNGTYRLILGNILGVVISTPEDIEAILTNNELLTKSHPYTFLNAWLGTGLLTATGQKWHARRKIITPSFHFKILEEFVSVLNHHGNVLVQSLGEHCGKGAFNVEILLKKCTLDVICETAMGTLQKEGNLEYIHAVEKICEVLIHRMNRPWLFNPIMYALSGGLYRERQLLKVLKNYTNKVIKEKKDQLNNSKTDKDEDDLGIKKRTGFLEQLLKIKAQGNSALLTDDDIMEEVNTFMFAGHDTSTAALCYALNLLGENPEVQEKLHEDLNKMFDKDQDFTREDLNEMKYLERVIKETMRVYPPIPFIGRKITEDITLPSGYFLPDGAEAFININYNHKNEKYYKNPDEFNPDNFLPEEISRRHPFSFIPFSAGPRNCIGQKFAMMEIKTVLAKIVLNFQIGKAGDGFAVVPDPNMVLHSRTGHKIRISKR